MIVLARHQSVLASLGLSTLEQVRNFQGEIVKVHGRRRTRDVLRIRTFDETGAPLVLYLKRTWHAHLKDGLRGLLRHGQVRSISRTEWDNSLRLQKAGFKTAPLVACGEECGWFGERFSFLITESVPCDTTVERFLHCCDSPVQRRRILDALAHYVRRLHGAGLASPDLFTRHLYLDLSEEKPEFHLIDMARLDHVTERSISRRARDLAALNVTAPSCDVTSRERLRFMRHYDARRSRPLLRRVIIRMRHLLRRKKYADYNSPRSAKGRDEADRAQVVG